jgi:hypothetical protein
MQWRLKIHHVHGALQYPDRGIFGGLVFGWIMPCGYIATPFEIHQPKSTTGFTT